MPDPASSQAPESALELQLAALLPDSWRRVFEGFHATGADLVVSDAVSFLESLRRAGLRPRLIYMDPPFAVNRDFEWTRTVEVRGVTHHRTAVAYGDRWEGGLEGYLRFMEEVLVAAHAALDEDGSLLLHCDYHAAPYLQIIADRVFGQGDRVEKHTAGFRNELIWSYGLGGSSPRCYAKKHDNIYWYSRSDRWTFSPPMIPATSQRLAGQLKKSTDVLQVPTINNMAHERTGYPTQKPLELLNLLVRAHTQPGDLVVDPFCGSGTTALAAAQAGRPALTCDVSVDAVDAAFWRLAGEGTTARLWQALPPARRPTGQMDLLSAFAILDLRERLEDERLQVRFTDAALEYRVADPALVVEHAATGHLTGPQLRVARVLGSPEPIAGGWFRWSNPAKPADVAAGFEPRGFFRAELPGRVLFVRTLDGAQLVARIPV